MGGQTKWGGGTDLTARAGDQGTGWTWPPVTDGGQVLPERSVPVTHAALARRGERMHRTNHFLKLGACGLVCAGLARGTGGTPVAHAQEPVPPPAAGAAAQPGQPPKAVVVPINGTAKVSMTPKRVIRSAFNEKETVARVLSIADDPAAVLVQGLQAGSTRVTLTDANGVKEVVEVIVQFDIDTVRSVLKRAVPTASVEPIPAGTNTIILVGNVAHPEDIEVILRVAQGVLVSGGAQGGGPTAAPQGA